VQLFLLLLFMITVYQAHSSFDAKLIQDQLSFEGIDSHIMGDLLQGGMGELQAHGLVKLMVDEEDREKSLVAIENWKNTKITDNETSKSETTTPKSNKSILFFVIVFVLLGFYFLAEY
jgi:hypothetical protein